MATSNIQLNVTGNAQQQLDAIDKKVNGLTKNFQRMGNDLGALNGVFSRLGTILGGIALTNFGMNALKAADDVNDLSEAIGVTVAEIKNLQAAFVASGGDADGASTALTRLSKAVSEARQGNEGLRKTFEEVGVSQEMLARGNLSEILRQTFAGMEQLGPSVDRTATSMELLGKTNNTLNFEKVNRELDANIGKYKELEPYLVAQGNLYENIKKIGKDYSESLGKDTEGLITMFAELTKNTKAIAEALSELTKIALAFGAAFLIFGKIIPYLSTVGGLIAGMGRGAGFLATQIGLLGKSFAAIFTNLVKVVPLLASFFGLTTRFGGLTSFLFALKALASFALRFAGLAGILYGVASAVDFVVEKFTGFSIFDWVSEKASYLTDKLKGLLKLLGLINEEESKPPPTPAAAPGTPAAPADSATLEASKQQTGLQNAIQNVTKAYREQAAERVQALQNELKYLGLSEDQVELEKNKLAIEKERDKALADLAEKEKEIISDTELSKAAKGALLAEIYKQRDAVKIVAEEELKSTTASITGLQQRKAATEDLRKSIEDMGRAFALSEELTDLQERLNLIGLTGDALERQTAMLKIEKDYRTELYRIAMAMHQLEIDRIKLGEEAYQKELQRLQEQIAMAGKLREAQIAGYDEGKKKTEESRQDFVGGWNQALEDYVKNSQDKAKQAGDLFKTMTQGLEDAFVNFAKTGKLSFNDLINTIVESIIRSQIQNLIATIFTPLTGGGGGGIFGSILGAIFGKRANGGPVSDNKPYMVGEKGPELFVPNTAGNIVPNNQLNSNNNVQAPAPITNNYITNNISALDSKSVAQLFAENRKTLLGTVQMAQRELP